MERHLTLTSTLYHLGFSKEGTNGSSRQKAVSYAESVRLNGAIFSQEIAESREFVTVQPCQIFLPQDKEGYEPNYIIIWHRKHIFVSYRLPFRAFSYCSGVLHNWDMNDYAMCNSHCFLMLSKSVVHPLTDMTEVLKKKIGKTVYKYWIESRRVT